jgi:A/G-specific adenine glycosylase
VLPAHRAWLARWPTPAALAGATPADAVRQWDRLGYPRRAVRLHAAARIITDHHGGEVPASLQALLELPGVGAYTAAAVASFAFGQRHPVLDTNVRRVLGRLIGGQELPSGSVSAAETALAESLLPADGLRAARWSVAVMELGALVCTAARPSCDVCPVAADCSWRLRGSPSGAPRRRAQPYVGSDRQCRGALLAALRAASGPVPAAALDACWPGQRQRARVLDGLISDGLVAGHAGDLVGLPGETTPAPRLGPSASGQG